MYPNQLKRSLIWQCLRHRNITSTHFLCNSQNIFWNFLLVFHQNKTLRSKTKSRPAWNGLKSCENELVFQYFSTRSKVQRYSQTVIRIKRLNRDITVLVFFDWQFWKVSLVFILCRLLNIKRRRSLVTTDSDLIQTIIYSSITVCHYFMSTKYSL